MNMLDSNDGEFSAIRGQGTRNDPLIEEFIRQFDEDHKQQQAQDSHSFVASGASTVGTAEAEAEEIAGEPTIGADTGVQWSRDVQPQIDAVRSSPLLPAYYPICVTYHPIGIVHSIRSIHLIPSDIFVRLILFVFQVLRQVFESVQAVYQDEPPHPSHQVLHPNAGD